MYANEILPLDIAITDLALHDPNRANAHSIGCYVALNGKVIDVITPITKSLDQHFIITLQPQSYEETVTFMLKQMGSVGQTLGEASFQVDQFRNAGAQFRAVRVTTRKNSTPAADIEVTYRVSPGAAPQTVQAQGSPVLSPIRQQTPTPEILDSLHTQIDQLKADNESLQRHVQTLQDENGWLKQRTSRLTDIEQYSQETISLRDRLDALTKENMQLQTDAETLQAQAAKWKLDSESLAQTLLEQNELKLRLQEAESDPKCGHETLIAELRQKLDAERENRKAQIDQNSEWRETLLKQMEEGKGKASSLRAENNELRQRIINLEEQQRISSEKQVDTDVALQEKLFLQKRVEELQTQLDDQQAKSTQAIEALTVKKQATESELSQTQLEVESKSDMAAKLEEELKAIKAQQEASQKEAQDLKTEYEQKLAKIQAETSSNAELANSEKKQLMDKIAEQAKQLADQEKSQIEDKKAYEAEIEDYQEEIDKEKDLNIENKKMIQQLNEKSKHDIEELETQQTELREENVSLQSEIDKLNRLLEATVKQKEELQIQAEEAEKKAKSQLTSARSSNLPSRTISENLIPDQIIPRTNSGSRLPAPKGRSMTGRPKQPINDPLKIYEILQEFLEKNPTKVRIIPNKNKDKYKYGTKVFDLSILNDQLYVRCEGKSMYLREFIAKNEQSELAKSQENPVAEIKKLPIPEVKVDTRPTIEVTPIKRSMTANLSGVITTSKKVTPVRKSPANK